MGSKSKRPKRKITLSTREKLRAAGMKGGLAKKLNSPEMRERLKALQEHLGEGLKALKIEIQRLEAGDKARKKKPYLH